jgi:hypothetical protein
MHYRQGDGRRHPAVTRTPHPVTKCGDYVKSLEAYNYAPCRTRLLTVDRLQP